MHKDRYRAPSNALPSNSLAGNICLGRQNTGVALVETGFYVCRTCEMLEKLSMNMFGQIFDATLLNVTLTSASSTIIAKIMENTLFLMLSTCKPKG